MSLQSYSTVLLRWIIVAAFLVSHAASVPSWVNRSECNSFNCDTGCDESDSRNHQPQRCSRCCSNTGDGGSGGSSKAFGDRLNAMESAVFELRVMTGVLLFFVLLLVLAVGLLLLNIGKGTSGKFSLPDLFRCKKNKNGEKENNSQQNCNGVGNRSTVSRLADHQSNSSPYSRRASMPATTPVNTDLEAHPFPLRKRQPSESTCPEEGSDVTAQGYDNLALSTSTINTSSTLHNTSTDTLSPTLSTNTMQTTLHSENHLQSAVHNNTNV